MALAPTPPPSDPSLLQVALSRGELAYADEGRGPVLVAIHGTPGTHRDFRYLAGALGGRLRLVRPDLPGFGRSGVTVAHAATPGAMADVIVELLERLDLERVVLLGHSMGGAIALRAAVRSSRVAGLALVASPGLRPHRGFVKYSIRTLGLAVRIPVLARLLYAPIRNGFRRSGFSAELTDADFVRAILCASALSFDQQRRLIAQNRLPCLVAWSDDDPFVEAAVSTELAAACPAGPRLAFSEGGHNIQKTAAGPLAERLASWAREVAEGSAPSAEAEG
jgi:pimeloyl-ACP methyl ester carboxylesterase